MIRIRVVVWLLAALVAVVLRSPPPRGIAAVAGAGLVVHWERPGVARLAWDQPAGVVVTCVSRNQTLIRCWNNLPAERYIMLLGNVGPLDGAYRPMAGDVFVLQQDGAISRAKLEGVVYLPVLRR